MATTDYDILAAAIEAVEEFRSRLGKDLGTEVRTLDIVQFRFCRVKEWHQKRNYKVSLASGKGGGGNRGIISEAEAEMEDLRLTLSVEDWVRQYGYI